MSSAEAIAKLQSLSPERAGKVFALVEDLAELGTLKNTADLITARASLTEGGPAVPHDQLPEEAGLRRRCSVLIPLVLAIGHRREVYR